MFANILPVIDELVAQRLFEVRVEGTQTRDAVHGIARKMEPVEFVEYGHVERSGGGALFPITVYMEIHMVRAFVGQTVNERGIAVEGEDHGFVRREDGIEFAVGKSVRMFGRSLQRHEIDDVDDVES